MAISCEGPVAPAAPLFLKQYGAIRTGTNYLRALIGLNYPPGDVVVLMHVLGDKHGPPPPFDDLWRRAQGDRDPAFSFVLNATRHAPPASPSPDQPRQREAFRSIATSLARAFREGSLGFLVSIKDPYAWVVSVARYRGWADRGSPLRPHLARVVERECAAFNASYAVWLAEARRNPARWHVVPYEDLVPGAERVLAEIDAKFALRRGAESLRELPTEAYAAIWDHDSSKVTPIRFDRAYYLEKRYLAQLSRPLVDVITRSIDWQLIAPLGYAPAG